MQRLCDQGKDRMAVSSNSFADSGSEPISFCVSRLRVRMHLYCTVPRMWNEVHYGGA